MLSDFYKKHDLPLDTLFGKPFPRYFIHPAAEYVALSTTAGVLDLTHWHALRLTGKDRQSFLNAMVTNDVAELGANQGCHALLTTVKGKIVSELQIFVREDDVLVFVVQGDAEETLAVLNKHIIMEDVEVEDASADFGVLALQGPKAYDILWRLFPTGPFPKEDQTGVPRQFEQTDLYVMKCARSGTDCYQIMIRQPQLLRLRNYIVQAARGSDGLPIGSIAWNMHRIEQGQPWFGIDYSEDNFPQESRLEHTVSYSKGCFRGQETIARLKYRGHVNRLLVGLSPDEPPGDAVRWRRIEAEFRTVSNNYDEIGLRGQAEAAAAALDISGLLRANSDLFSEGAGKPIGRITSSAYSPALGRPLALGYVRFEASDPGSAIHLPKPPLHLHVIDLPVDAPSNDSPTTTP